MHLIIRTSNISDGFGLSRGAFYSSIGTNGVIGTNGMALTPLVGLGGLCKHNFWHNWSKKAQFLNEHCHGIISKF